MRRRDRDRGRWQPGARIRRACGLAALVLAWPLALPAQGPEQAQSPAPSPIEARPFYFALSVSDVEASSAWYSRVLGFFEHRSIDLEERGVRIRLLRRPGALLELVESAEASSAGALDPPLEQRFLLHGVYKIGFEVASLDATIEQLEAHDVPLRGRVIEESDGSARSLQIEDPDGNVLQLFELIPRDPG